MMTSDFSYIKCNKCESFDTERCIDCMWRVEYGLLKQYGSWQVAKSRMQQEFDMAKSKNRDCNI